MITSFEEKMIITSVTFLELMIQISFLFVVISFFVAIINQKIPKNKIQKILGSNKKGYLIAAGLGAVTPFCSCSTIPMLMGLFRAQASFGPIMTFLFTSPLLNPIIIVLFVPVIGPVPTLLYASIALTLSIIAGILLQFFKFQKFVHKDTIFNDKCGNNSQSVNTKKEENSKVNYKKAWQESIGLFKSILPYILIAMVIGAVVTGFVPNDFFSKIAGADNTMAVPVAATIGIPLYVRVTSLIPLVGAFIAKGVSIGAIIALIIGAGGASLPEMILLKKLFLWPLLFAFLSAIFFIAIIGGYAFNIFLA